jgi:hypothetical protein
MSNKKEEEQEGGFQKVANKNDEIFKEGNNGLLGIELADGNKVVIAMVNGEVCYGCGLFS